MLNKLHQLEIQLTSTNLRKTSPQLAELHAQCSKAIEEASEAPISEGYALLNIAAHGNFVAEGIRRMVDVLENKKISLDNLCTAHREENIRINSAINNFLEQHNEIYTWLITVGEAFLQSHGNMGNDLEEAREFLELHSQLLCDLQVIFKKIAIIICQLLTVLFLDQRKRN